MDDQWNRAEFELVADKIFEAACAEDVFGSDPSRAFQQLAKICHPDTVGAPFKAQATDVFARLGQWRANAKEKLANGSYGDRKPPSTPKGGHPYLESEITIDGVSFRLVRQLGTGVAANVHEAKVAGASGESLFLKIARNPTDNDLLEREFKNLQAITAIDRDPVKEREFLSKHRVYVPQPRRSLLMTGTDKRRHRANLLSVPNGQCLTLEELIALPKFKDGLPPEHTYWIYRRLLLTLWMAHMRGIAHGAPTPDHVLVYPKEHGVVLLGWTASAKIGAEHHPVYDKQRSGFLAPEVLLKAQASPSLDMYTLAKTALHAVKDLGRLPVEVRRLLDRCLAREPNMRPNDAEEFYREFETVIEMAHGPRKFVALEV